MAKRTPRAAGATSSTQFVTQTHPLYDEWIASWWLAGENYEGDGGYLDGMNLIPHPRELNYAQTASGTDFTQVVGAKQKLIRRRQLARYDNFAQALTDIFVDHQYAKGISRTWKHTHRADDNYLRWIEDVDGAGTHLDDWLKQRQVLAHTYGHVFAYLDRAPGLAARPRTRAEQGRLVLRYYIPPDTLDWLAPHKHLTGVKFAEAVERTSLMQPSTFSSAYHGATASESRDDLNVEYLFIDDRAVLRYDAEGTAVQTSVQHGFGELPVAVFYSKRRARIPVLGRMLLKDPRLFRDHYNMISELRELLRSQTFSMLHIQLQENETVDSARARLGDHAGTDTVLFTMGGAEFIAPADGPVATYATQIDAAERKMFRLIGLPWEADSRDAEAEGSRKLKAQDLNRTLAGHADEAERFEYQLARLFYVGFYGRQVGLQRWQDNPPVIKHPDEFNTEEILAVVEDTKGALGLQLGQTANTLLRKRAVPIVLKDLDADTRRKIDAEIEATPYSPQEAAGEFGKLLDDAEAAADADADAQEAA
jgi:hypothetical protein